MGKKRILIGIAAMFAVVANFETKAAEPLPEYAEPVTEMVQLTSDSWFMIELSRALIPLDSEHQDVATKLFMVFQEFINRNAVDTMVFQVPPGIVLKDVPQQMQDNLVENFFHVLTFASDAEMVGILLAIVGCQLNDDPVIEDVEETVINIVEFMRYISILSGVGAQLTCENNWESLRGIPRDVAKANGLIEDIKQDDMFERVRMAVRSAVTVQIARRHSEVHGCEKVVMTEADVEARRKALFDANIDITDETLHPMYTDERDWNERVNVTDAVWRIFGTLIRNDFRRNVAKSDLFAAMFVTHEQLTNGLTFGLDMQWTPRDLTKLQFETDRTIGTVRGAYESFWTLIWSAKQCCKSVFTPHSHPIKDAFACFTLPMGMSGDSRTMESLMMMAILILREERGLFVFDDNLVELDKLDAFHLPLPDRLELCRVFEDMRRLFITEG
ncbi:MAG: hypothetical protein LBT03_00490 [Holosporales bacterium]|jgi:hypothetical protein|nr:hypothetical protein [Holosporales bacterium]